jgi:hypothetical protein
LSLARGTANLARSGKRCANPLGPFETMRSLTILVLLLIAACTSSGGASSTSASPAATAPAKQGQPLRMTVCDYRSGAVFELVNQSHTSAVEQYSKLAGSASRKVQDDEIMSALRAYLDDQGFARLSQVGKAPTYTKGAKAWTLEVADAHGERFLLATPQTGADDMQALRTMLDAVLATYNETQGWQAVDIKAKRGEDYFNDQRPAVKKP